MDVLFLPQMASNICQRLIKKVWKSYGTDLPEAPQSEGIYAIGFSEVQPYPLDAEVIYVGRSKHIRKRLQQHKSDRKQKISKFVKKQFAKNDETNLCIKWVEVKDSQCLEGEYLNCMYDKLGYWPRFNLKGGDTCN